MRVLFWGFSEYVLPERRFSRLVGLVWGTFLLSLLLIISVLLHVKWLMGDMTIGHDMLTHLRWMHSFREQITAGIIYPRWLPEINNGYGGPDFIFYPPLTFFLGSLARSISDSWPQAIGLIYIFITFTAGVLTYVSSRLYLGKLASAFTSLVFILSDYFMHNFYARAAIPESLALVCIPLMFWASGKSVENKKYFIAISLAISITAITHLPSLVFYSSFFLLYAFLLNFLSNGLPYALLSFPSVVLGWSLSFFYLLPAIIERKNVNIEYMKDVIGGYRSNFIYQAGANSFGLTKVWESITFWNLSLVVSIALICALRRRRPENHIIVLSIGCLVCGWMMTTSSSVLWDNLEVLQSLQFPWRLLGLYSFLSALIIGSFIDYFAKYFQRRSKLVYVLIMLLCLTSSLILLRDTKRYVYDWPSLNNPRWYDFSPAISGMKAALEDEQSLTNNLVVPEYRPAPEKIDSSHILGSKLSQLEFTSEEYPSANTSLVEFSSKGVKYSAQWFRFYRLITVESAVPLGEVLKVQLPNARYWSATVNSEPLKLRVLNKNQAQVYLADEHSAPYRIQFLYGYYPYKDRDAILVHPQKQFSATRIEIKKWQGLSRKVSVSAPESVKLDFQIFYFPTWKVYINGIASEIKKSLNGTVLVTLNPGDHDIELVQEMTPSMKLGLFISIASLAITFLAVYRVEPK